MSVLTKIKGNSVIDPIIEHCVSLTHHESESLAELYDCWNDIPDHARTEFLTDCGDSEELVNAIFMFLLYTSETTLRSLAQALIERLMDWGIESGYINKSIEFCETLDKVISQFADNPTIDKETGIKIRGEI